MIELEILVEVFSSYEDAIKKLENYSFHREDRVIDIYYYDPLRDTLKPIANRLRASFRARNNGTCSYITYKDDVYDGDKWLYSNENEIEVNDFNVAQSIISRLGFKELVRISNIKKIYSYDVYEIILEKVDKLGVFLEVELKKQIRENDVMREKMKIQAFIDSLNLIVSKELNCGKPELLLKRYNKTL